MRAGQRLRILRGCNGDAKSPHFLPPFGTGRSGKRQAKNCNRNKPAKHGAPPQITCTQLAAKRRKIKTAGTSQA